MRSEELEGLREALRRGGVARRYIRRTLAELADHFEDLEADALAAGCTPADAARRARESLGSDESITAAVLARSELQGLGARWPRTARCLGAVSARARPGACLLGHGAELARWSVSTGLSFLLTCGMLLALSSALHL